MRSKRDISKSNEQQLYIYNVPWKVGVLWTARIVVLSLYSCNVNGF